MAFRWGERNCSQQPFQTTTRGLFSITKFDALRFSAQLRLDGVIQSPGGPKEDPSGDFRLGGWIVPYADELIDQALQDLVSQPFELLLGRHTYEIFAAYWPRKGADPGSHPIADRFNSVPKHVATHRSDGFD